MKRGIRWGPVAAFAHLGREDVHTSDNYTFMTNPCVIKWQPNMQTCENISNGSEVGICITPFVVQITKVHIQLEIVSQHLFFLSISLHQWNTLGLVLLLLLYFPFDFLVGLVFHPERNTGFPLPVTRLSPPFLVFVNVVPESVFCLGQSPNSPFHHSCPVVFCSFSPAASAIVRQTQNNQNDCGITGVVQLLRSPPTEKIVHIQA